MELNSKNVHQILKNKGVETLYHANSVVTACQFLRHHALLSRGVVQRMGLYQTPQVSDNDDQRWSIWFDVFTDHVNIHHRAGRKNAYGPVLFEFSVDILLQQGMGNVWLTKSNPMYWKNTFTYEKRWFVSKEDVETNFQNGTFEFMLVHRHIGGVLPFHNCLLRLHLDDPNLPDLHTYARGALHLAMTEGQQYVPIQKHQCQQNCTCHGEYRADVNATLAMFYPGQLPVQQPAAAATPGAQPPP